MREITIEVTGRWLGGVTLMGRDVQTGLGHLKHSRSEEEGRAFLTDYFNGDEFSARIARFRPWVAAGLA